MTSRFSRRAISSQIKAISPEALWRVRSVTASTVTRPYVLCFASGHAALTATPPTRLPKTAGNDPKNGRPHSGKDLTGPPLHG